MSKKKEPETEPVNENPTAAAVPVKPPVPKAVSDLLARKLAAQAKIIKDAGASGCVGTELKAPKFYPTGLPVFDQEVLGIGGMPKGRIIEVYGPKSSGKSALAFKLAAQVQAEDPAAVVKIYDLEGCCTPAWLLSMGLDLSRTIVVPTMESPEDQAREAEEAAERAKEEAKAKAKNKDKDKQKGKGKDKEEKKKQGLKRILTAEEMGSMVQADLASGILAPSLIIIDSIAVVQSAGVMEKEFEDLNMKDNLARADFLTKFFNSLTYGFYWPPAGSDGLSKDARTVRIADTDVCLVCINHAKQRTVKVGQKTIQEWYSVGGVALDFHACLQLMVTRRGFEMGTDGKPSHQRVHVCADKNKIAPPKRDCDMLLSFKGGMEQLGTIDWCSIAITKGLAEKNGAWVVSHVLLEGGKIQGVDNFNKYIEDNEDKKKLLID